MRVFRKYIKGKASVIMSYLPSGKVLPARKDNFYGKMHSKNDFEKVNYENLTHQKAHDNFDRNIQPSAGTRPVLKYQNTGKHHLKMV